MGQALHIFRKDVRCFWYEIAVVLAVCVLNAWVQGSSDPPVALGIVLSALLPMAWLYLVARVIQEEPLPGDRQFWITRPYDRRCLLLAKILFILVFLHIPQFLANCVILASTGFSPLTYLPGLLWKQFAIFAGLILPAAALAAITRNLVEMFAAVFAALVASFWIILGRRYPIELSGGEMYWIPWTMIFALWCAAAIAILISQYGRRRTTLCRGIAALAAGLTPVIYPSIDSACAIQAHFPKAPAEYAKVDVAFDPGPRRPTRTPTPSDAFIPIRVTGLAPGTDCRLDGAQLSVGLGDGTQVKVALGASLVGQGEKQWIEVRDHGPANVRRISLELTVFTKAQVTDVPQGSTRFQLPDAGFCQASAPDAVECVAPLRIPPRIVAFSPDAPEQLPVLVSWPASYSPFPAEMLSGPVVKVGWMPGEGWPNRASHLIYVNERPVAHLRRDFDVPGIRLLDYTPGAN